MPDNTDVKNQVSVSGQASQKLDVLPTSENLPKNVSFKLYELMTKVVMEDVNPKTVQAACACATEIHRMLKLNLDLKRSGL
jgi:hypothetical protein